MPEFVERDDDHRRWKQAVLARDRELPEVDTSPAAMPRPQRAHVNMPAESG
jgi:hypothetical protein